MVSKRAIWGVGLVGLFILAIAFNRMFDAKHIAIVDKCRAELSAEINKPSDYDLELCYDEFPGVTKQYKSDIQTLYNAKEVANLFAWIFGIAFMFFLLPSWVKWAWQFFLKRLSEIAAAIRGMD